MDAKKKLAYDVVVVGGGNAGIVAAIGAKNCGASVLLLEKSPKKVRGGNSRYTEALFRVAVERGTEDYKSLVEREDLPKEEFEIEPYTKDQFYSDFIRLTDGRTDRRIAEIVVNRSLETVAWMKEQGLRWVVYGVENPRASASSFARVGNRLFLPSGQLGLQALGSGEGLVEQLYGIAEKKGIDILYETAARKLIMNSDGKVVGLVALDKDGFIQVDSKNVILASGGFQANPAWRRQYLGENWDLIKLRGTHYNTGDGIEMAQEIGVQLTGHWGGCHATVVSEDSPAIEGAALSSERYSYPLSITVNRNGERFMDEGENYFLYTYAKLGRGILKQPGQVAYQIYDAKMIPILYNNYQNAVHVESNSLKELAEELDINVEKFLKTVGTFNDAVIDEKPFTPFILDGRCTKGLNPDKSNWAQKIDTPPFRGYAVVCGLTMTYGGLRTNEKAEVLNTSDSPIKGFYAIGEVTGGYFYFNYPGGTGLIRGAVMGRIAGAEAGSNL